MLVVACHYRTPSRIVVIAVALLSCVATLLVSAPKAKAASCVASARSHSTSLRSGTVRVLACSAQPYYGSFHGEAEVVTSATFGLQTYYMNLNVQVLDSAGAVKASKACNTPGTSDSWWLEMCYPNFSPTAGRAYRTRSILSYDVKDDGAPPATLTAVSPFFVV